MRPWPSVLLVSLLGLFACPTAHAQDLPLRTFMRVASKSVMTSMAGKDGRVAVHARIGEERARAIGLTPVAPGMAGGRVRPDELGPLLAAHPDIELGWHPPLRPRLDRSTVWSRVPDFRANTGLDGTGVVVGIVDTGIDVVHPDLRNEDGSTRIAWLLDLSRGPLGTHPEVEEEFGCSDESQPCAVYDASDIDAAIASTLVTAAPRDAIGHGTHVASIAAGNGLGSVDRKLAGMAPGATIVAARVTRSSGEDISDVDALLATRFIFDRADAMGLPAVANLSLGADFGPHDGTSWLEQGMASFVGPERPGHAIVVASGNSGGLYLVEQDTYGIHTEARVYPRAETRVPMRAVAYEGATISGSIYVWISWQAEDGISVGLEGPDGDEWLPVIPSGRSGEADVGADGADASALVINEMRGGISPIPNGTHGAVLVVDGEWSASGDLTILLEGEGTAELWVQGVGDAGMGSSGLGYMFARAVKHGTVNMPGTHPSLIAVGATLNRATWNDANGKLIEVDQFGPQSPPIEDSIAYFSGAGPTTTGRPKPDISAPGVFIAAAMSRDADPSENATSMFAAPDSSCPSGSSQCLVVDGRHAIATGTSMATPAVAGAVALLMSLDPTLTSPEVLALLQAGARYPRGTVPYPFQMGPGALDVEGARESLELMGLPRERVPDGARSWVVMGTPYARPDPDWPVCGYVETRTAEGAIADGFDEGMLTLAVTNAVVTQALTRMAPGLYTFCVAAPAGSGGGTVGIEVFYVSERVGEAQSLPIGVDPFVAAGGVRALGGCSLVGPRWWGGMDWLVGVLLLVGSRLRRRAA